jgi:hypothetical protein
MNNNNYNFAVLFFVCNGKTLVLVPPKIALPDRVIRFKNTVQSVNASDISSKINPFYFSFDFMPISFLGNLAIMNLRAAFMKRIKITNNENY